LGIKSIEPMPKVGIFINLRFLVKGITALELLTEKGW
jgi:hypothetical protein